MVSRNLMGVWFALDAMLLVAGIIAVVLSQLWRTPNVLMNMVLSNGDLTAGTVLGIALIVTFVISIAAVVQKNHVTSGLVLLNYVLILDALGIIVIGTFVWWFTLKERVYYRGRWANASVTTRIALQDQFKCCGYFDGSDLAEIGGNYCTSQEFINALETINFNNFCVTPITSFSDRTLNDIFTTVYGFTAIVICLLLATLCVIKKRQEYERFKKIDSKRGGHGFV